MKTSQKHAVAAVIAIAVACMPGAAAASRSARLPARMGFPLLGNQGDYGSISAAYSCFGSYSTNGYNFGNGSIFFLHGACPASYNYPYATWVMPFPTETRASSVSINAYVVTTGSPVVSLSTWTYDGYASSTSGLVTPVSPQTQLTATLPVGGYGQIFANVYSNQSVVEYAYEYDF